jgi:uncharacterized membrane protein
MNFAHLHLLLNHFPIIGTVIGLGLFLLSFLGKNQDLRRGSLIIFASVALLTIPTFMSGVGAQLKITPEPGVSTVLIERHEGAAMLSLWFMEVTGALALVALWQSHYRSHPRPWNVVSILVFSLLTAGLMARTGTTGGDIRHPEILANQEAPGTEGTIGSIIHKFEPTPARFTEAMIFSKWCTAVLMDLHFFGLVLIIGPIGIINLRIMGFPKQIPVAPLFKLLPLAMIGVAINVITGMCAFIGMPELYVYDAALWLKMLALLLLGVSLAAFYLTSIVYRVEHLGAGEDAPFSAKLVAASSLFLWFAVITLGRYIQLFGGTIPRG